MKEKDYVNATNLTKARIAKTIINDMLFNDLEIADMQKLLLKGLSLIIERLEKDI
ncbi:MAG: hypothetical protein PHW03_05325 [Eubacteriales bacterium]|nr:hypothetical protein [Eubacteriales bacterium]